MPRRPRVTEATLCAAALDILRDNGPAALTIGALAAKLGVQPPSLYNHVTGIDEVRERLRVVGLDKLAQLCGDAVDGRGGADAIRALARAWRAFARDNPALYTLTVETTEGAGDAVRAAGQRVLQPVFALLRGCGVAEPDLVHAARAVRAALHGFVGLELNGGFGLPDSVDESYARVIEMLVAFVLAGATFSGPDSTLCRWS